MMPFLYLLLVPWITAAPAQDEPAPPISTSASLTIELPGHKVANSVQGTGGRRSRPLFTCKAGEKPAIHWEVRNDDLHRALNSVVVHFLVNHEDQLGAPIPSHPQVGTLFDSVLGTDLAPGEANSGDNSTPIYDRGAYLVEIELLNANGERLQYCAADLEVE